MIQNKKSAGKKRVVSGAKNEISESKLFNIYEQANQTDTMYLHSMMLDYYVLSSKGTMTMVETSVLWETIKETAELLKIDFVAFSIINQYALAEAFRVVNGKYNEDDEIIKNFNK